MADTTPEKTPAKRAVKAVFEPEKSTKNTIRYRETGPEDKHIAGVIYLRKSATERLKAPSQIVVTVSAK